MTLLDAVDVSKDFAELFGALRSAGVRFVVVGGYAVAFHAKPRYTKSRKASRLRSTNPCPIRTPKNGARSRHRG